MSPKYDRIWAETNLNFTSAKNASTRAEVESRFVKPFLESDNRAVVGRLDILQFHQCMYLGNIPTVLYRLH
jgi:hypothetical protein